MGKLLVIMLVGMFFAFQSLEALDYNDALDKAILFFEGQRSGKLPNQRVKWRGDSALKDGELANVDLVGGYYDAGDNVKFLWPMSFTTTLLSWATIEYKNEITSVNQLENLRTAIKWGTDYILLAHPSPNILYTQVGNVKADHACWQRPEDMDTPRTLYSITPETPGSEVAGEAAAALAAAAIVFKEGDDHTYSTTLLNHSKILFDFANTYKSSITSCDEGFYCSHSYSDNYKDELLWAAAWLYKATQDNKYINYVINNKAWSYDVNESSWDNKFAAAQALLASFHKYGTNDDGLEDFTKHAESFVCAMMPGSNSPSQIPRTSGGLLFTRDSSNLQYVTMAATILFQYSRTLTKANIVSIQCGFTQFTVSQIQDVAKYQVDYILGNNPVNMSYMVGFGTNFPKQLHHRGSSIPSIQSHPEKIECHVGYGTYYPSLDINPNEHTGAIVGGPNSSDQFSDQRSDHKHTEPTTYINAAFIGPLAALIGMNSSQKTVMNFSEQTNV